MDCILPGPLCSWDFPGKNTGVGSHFLPQGIFLTQGSNPHLLHWQVGSLPLCHLGSPCTTRICVFEEGVGQSLIFPCTLLAAVWITCLYS